MPQNLIFGALVCAGMCIAQATTAQNFIVRWQARATETQALQPHWATPVATSTPRIDQAMRAEFSRQTNTGGYRTWDLGNNKGLELLPARNTELIFGVPPFFVHSQPHTADGFGDVWFEGKYRFFARNEQHGNAVLTAILRATVPTGKYVNGSCCATVTPTLAAGKGLGRFDYVTTVVASLPISNVYKLGHTITWNNVAQYRIGAHGFTNLLVPEVELNSTFYHGGADDGKIATFATPGLVFGRIPLSHDADRKPGRRALTLAAGEQIALTRFHTYNHGLIVSVRMPF
jgi:hypothetical protein